MSSPWPFLNNLSHVSDKVILNTQSVTSLPSVKSGADIPLNSLSGTRFFTFNTYPSNVVTKNGLEGRTFFHDFYNRIHITPGKLELGNILSTQTRNVTLWNAYLDGRTITNYTEPSSLGFSIISPVSVPYTFRALEEITYTSTVAVDGPPQFNITVTWDISGITYKLPVSGQRVIVWPFAPNWKKPVKESLEWKTDVIRAFDGDEQRIELRSKPRRTISYKPLVKNNDLSLFNNLLFGWQNRLFAVPIWHDKYLLKTAITAADTSIPVKTFGRTFFVEGLVILFKNVYEYEVVEALNINAESIDLFKPLQKSWPIGTPVYPLNLARLPTNISYQMLTSKVTQPRLDWVMDSVSSDPAIPSSVISTTFKGVELVTTKPNWGKPITVESQFGYSLFDGNIGAFQQIQTVGVPSTVYKFQWVLKSRQQNNELRAFLGRLKGQAKAVYLPTGLHDLEITQSISVGSTSIVVKHSDFDRYVNTNDMRNALMIRLKDGYEFTTSITGTTPFSEEEEVISLSDAFDRLIDPSEVAMVSIVHLARSLSDGFTINYLSDSVSIVDLTMITVKK